jgi:hypothetical protein
MLKLAASLIVACATILTYSVQFRENRTFAVRTLAIGF